MGKTKKALVTGGTGALGLAVAHTLRAAGYETHVTSSSPASAESFSKSPESKGLTVHAVDLAEADDVARLFKEMSGPLAVLVSTVGGYA